jgi:hypothetical protein
LEKSNKEFQKYKDIQKNIEKEESLGKIEMDIKKFKNTN